MSDLAKGYVVTGGGRGVGRAIVDRLLVHDAHVAVIELDDASSFISGAVLPVDGGRSAQGQDPKER